MIEYLPNIVISILIFFLVIILKRIFDNIIDKFSEKVYNKDLVTWVRWLHRIVWILLVLLASLSIIQLWGVNITPILASVGIASIVIGLALQSTLSNIFSGMSITIDRSVRVGDLIELPDKNIVGRVEEMHWRSTKLRTIQNNIVYIPNSILSNSIIINYSQPLDEVNVWVEVGVSYFEDLNKVEQITLKVAEEILKTEHGVKSWIPKIYYYKFGDSNIYFYVVLRARNYFSIRPLVHEFIKALKREFDKEGVEISFPNVNVFFRNYYKNAGQP